jgi:hypothetical protein
MGEKGKEVALALRTIVTAATPILVSLDETLTEHLRLFSKY